MSLLLVFIAKFVWHLPVPWWLWTVSVLRTLYIFGKAFRPTLAKALAAAKVEVARKQAA